MNTSLVCWTLLTCMTCVLTACGTEEDKALPGDSDIVEGADDADGEPDAVDCSMDDGTCPEPCRSTWAVRYDPVLDCMASETLGGTSGTMLFACNPPDTSGNGAEACICDPSGACGLSGMDLPGPPSFIPCDEATYAAAAAAQQRNSRCPPGHFE
jgi:hypothetical protein